MKKLFLRLGFPLMMASFAIKCLFEKKVSEQSVLYIFKFGDLKKICCWFLLVCSFLQTGCNDEKIQPNSKLTFLWQNQYASEQELAYTCKPIVHKGIVVYCQHDLNSRPAHLVAFDQKTGAKKWEWKDALREGFGVAGSDYFIKDDILTIGSLSDSYGINLLTGGTVWKNNTGTSARVGVTGIGYRIFRTFVENSNDCVIYTADIRKGDWKPLYNLPNQQPYDPSQRTIPKLGYPIVYKGDTLLVFMQTYYNYKTNTKQDTLCALNLSDGPKLLWKRGVGTNDNLSLGIDTRFYDGKVYFSGNNIYCFELEKGNLVWQRDFPAGFSVSGLVLASGKVFGNNEDVNQFFLCVDAQTGTTIWKTSSGGSAGMPTYFQGNVYLPGAVNNAQNPLLIFDAATGAIVQSVEAPNEKKNSSLFFESELSIDTVNNLLFTSDFKYALAYKIVQ